MVKRKISYIISGICIAACVVVAGMWFLNRNKVKDDSVTVDIRTDTASAGENEESSWNTDVHGIAKAEGGYYFLQMKSKGMCLYFYDESVQRSIAVCSKAECNHDNVQCNAFFLTSEYLSSPIHYYQGNIYLVKVKNGMGVLTKIQPDGNEREEICELFPNANVTSVSMVFHDNAAYVYDHTGHAGSEQEQDETIKKVELDTKKSEDIYTYRGTGSAISGARSFGNKLFFKVRTYEINKDTLKQSFQYQLYAYDYDTGTVQTVAEGKNISDYYVDLQNNILYYYVIGEGLYQCRLDSSEQKLIYKADATIAVASLSFDGRYLYMGNGGIGSATDAKSAIDRVVYVLDTDGNVCNKINMQSNMKLYYGDADYLFAESGDKVFYISKADILTVQEWKELE